MSDPSRPVSGFVPLGDMAGAVDLPGGRAMTPHAATPQARHHFTRLDQIDQLVDASEADADLGFMARLLALCSLPRTNPGDRLQYKRVNGPYKLIMIAGGDNKLPYGNLPRLLLAWVCSEAVRTQRRELVLGRSLYEFMHKLGMENQSGGARGDRTRLKNQMRRLFTCSVQLVQRDGDHEVVVSSQWPTAPNSGGRCGNPPRPGCGTARSSSGSNFLTRSSRTLYRSTCTRSRRSSGRRSASICTSGSSIAPSRSRFRCASRGGQLYRQFGADPAKASQHGSVSMFRAACLRELKKINRTWPGLNYGTVTGGLVVSPSAPRIPPAQLRLISN